MTPLKPRGIALPSVLQHRQTRDWRGAMYLDRKSDNTIIEDRLENRILSITGSKAGYILGSSSQ
jgi:hypothetical protein